MAFDLHPVITAIFIVLIVAVCVLAYKNHQHATLKRRRKLHRRAERLSQQTLWRCTEHGKGTRGRLYVKITDVQRGSSRILTVHKSHRFYDEFRRACRSGLPYFLNATNVSQDEPTKDPSSYLIPQQRSEDDIVK